MDAYEEKTLQNCVSETDEEGWSSNSFKSPLAQKFPLSTFGLWSQ